MGSPRSLHFLRGFTLLSLLTSLLVSLPDCAKARCEFNSDCGDSARCVDGDCVKNCRLDLDCPDDKPICQRGLCVVKKDDAGVDDTSVTPSDGGDGGGADTKLPVDTATGTDTNVDDTTVSPVDTGAGVDTTVGTDVTGGIKGYLDGCAGDGECVSGACTVDAPRFCTKSCAASGECAHGQICAGGHCRLDDTGKTGCSPSTGSGCLLYCYGSATSAHCTKDCLTASDCPAGFACTAAGAGKKVCVDIERGCTAASQCVTGLGFCGGTSDGCTSECTSATDCPNRLIGLTPYACTVSGGKTVCVPPADVLGSDPLGATCAASGTNTCRSGGCDTATSPAMCNTRCTPQGGCPLGYGCFPDAGGGSVDLICTPAGSSWLGAACARARDCRTGLCQAEATGSGGYCTKLCNDSLCPTGMTCKASGLTASDGTAIKLCSK